MNEPCEQLKPSTLIEGHEHTCNGAHMDNDLHKCSDPTCRRWFS